MTLEEVLEASRGLPKFVLVVHAETGEFLAVLPHEGFNALNRPGGIHHFSLSAVDATPEGIVAKQKAALRMAGRRRIFAQWSVASVNSLVDFVEKGAFEFPLVERDRGIIVEHLWELHRAELTPAIQDRLHRGLPLLPERAATDLKPRLLALRGDAAALLELWSSRAAVHDNYSYAFALMDCLAHVQVSDEKFLEDLISIVETPTWLFGPRFETMKTLGKLNSAVGSRAVEVIRKVVYDSTPQIIATRDRVLERLTSHVEDWARCEACCYGRVHGESGCSGEECPTCHGLGLVRIGPMHGS